MPAEMEFRKADSQVGIFVTQVPHGRIDLFAGLITIHELSQPIYVSHLVSARIVMFRALRPFYTLFRPRDVRSRPFTVSP